MAALHFAQDFSISTSFTWISADAVAALHALGHEVTVQPGELAPTLEPEGAALLRRLQRRPPSPDATHIKWSHFWDPYLLQPLGGRLGLEIVALNHALATPDGTPSDVWMSDCAESPAHKLPISQFTRGTLLQNGVEGERMSVWNLGYSPQVGDVDEAREIDGAPGFRFLHITNATDPVRFGTDLLLQAFAAEFGPDDDVSLLVKDYNPAGTGLAEMIEASGARAPIVHLPEFSSRADMVRTYRACQALVAPFRGEGFGIKVLDALACDLPVVAPLFGGITDFCNHDRIYAVDYQCVDASRNVDVLTLKTRGRPVWCEVSMDSLRARMRAILEEPKRAGSRGRSAGRYVREWFGWPQAAERLVEIVNRLEAADEQARPADTPAPARLLV